MQEYKLYFILIYEMYKELIKEFQQDFNEKKVLKRDINFPYEILKLNKIITFVWPRRAGKTYFMFYVLKQLVNNNLIKLEDIVFIDFSAFLEEKLDVNNLLEDFYSLYPNRTPFFVFDEIQELDNFSKPILYLFNKWYKIFLSWSNSKLLSSQLSTQFRGRTFDIKVYPLSFNEFLYFKNIDKKHTYTTKERWKLKNLLAEYLQYWSYPEIALIDNKNIKQDLIKSYFEILLYKDLIERYGISNEYVLKFLFKKVLLNVTKEFSTTKTLNELKSQNIKLWIQTIYNYLEYMEDIFLISQINDLYKTRNRKYYLYDIGFINLVTKNNFWQRFENIIFTHLLRKYKDISYIKTTKWEIDFALEDKVFQVCYDLNYDNFEREIKLLSSIKNKEKYVVYFNKQEGIQSNDIKFINFFEFVDLLV